MSNKKFMSGNHQKESLHWKRLTFSRTLSAALIFIICFIPIGRCEYCSLPDTWTGHWFITELANGPPVLINSTSKYISRQTPNSDADEDLGHCVWTDGNFYIFKNARLACNRCIMLNERHKNVLYSREAFQCLNDKEWDKDDRDPKTLCADLMESYDKEVQYFWFRKDYKPVNCPFGNSAFQFSYKHGGAQCNTPVSHASGCIEKTKMELQYEACHDNSNSIGKVDQLTCVGIWEESGYGHFLADVNRMNNRGHRSLQERFRCFTYTQNTIANPVAGKPLIVTGYNVGTSDMASCKGLDQGPDEAETTIYLKKENPNDSEEKPCSFPQWLTGRNWTDMKESVKFELPLELKNRTIYILPIYPSSSVNKQKRQRTFFPLSHSSLTCVQTRNLSESNNVVAVVAKYTVGCKIDEICMHMIQRSQYVFQINYLERSEMDRKTLRDKCFNSTYSELQKGVTMVSTHGVRKACPSPGKYLPNHTTTFGSAVDLSVNHSAELSFDEEWSIGCYNSTDLHTFLTPNDVNLNFFSCMDGWSENNSTFTLVASTPAQNLYCMKTSGHAASASENVLFTSQDCIHISENNTLTTNMDNEIGSNDSPTSNTFKVQLHRNAFCNSDAVVENTDSPPGGSIPRGEAHTVGSGDDDSFNHNAGSSVSALTLSSIVTMLILLLKAIALVL